MKNRSEGSVSSSLASGDVGSDSKEKVLVVEDEEDLADLYTEWLSDEYEVRTAYSGDEAIKKYDEEIDVVLLDRHMPNVSGDEVLEDIRELPGDCMTAMVTAVEPDYDILSMEFEDYVQKPVSRDELLTVTNSLVTLSEYDDRMRRSFELASKSAALNLDELAKAARKEESDKESLLEGVVDTVSSICSPDLVVVWGYGEDGGSLTLQEHAGALANDIDEEGLGSTEELVWNAYSSDSESMEFTEDEIPDELPKTFDYCLCNRIGSQGVVLTFLSSDDSITESEKAAVRSATAMVGSSLESKKNKQRAEEHERISDEYKEKTARLEDVNRTMREASASILQATTRKEILRASCRELSESRFVEFAWIGEYVESGGKIDPMYSTDEGYMSSMEENGELENARRVAENRETVSTEIHREPPLEPWEEQALRNGFGSVIRVPVLHNSSLHGVLNVYLDEGEDMSDYLKSTVEDIGKIVGHAINSYEAKTSLVSNEVTELTVRIHDPRFPSIRFASEVGGVVSLEGISSNTEGSQRTYVTVNAENGSEDVKERVEKAAEKIPGIESFAHIASRDSEESFQLTGNPFFFEEILNQGGTPVDMHATGKSVDLTVRLPKYASASSLVSMIEEDYERVELLSTRNKKKEFETKSEFEEILNQKLTDRQLETAKTAYYSGYFNSPRESTGQDIAEQLGVTQPTVTESLKVAERKMFSLLFEDGTVGVRGSLE